MSVIGEAFLTASIELLFKKLTSPEFMQFARQEQIQEDLRKWERILLKIQAVLSDAEDKQTTKESVKIWLGELRNLAYDVEDILDEFATEALRRKLLIESEPEASTSMVCKLISIPTCCTGLSPQSVKLNSIMRSKIKEITVRLQDIATEKNNLDLKENSWGTSRKVREKLPTTSLLNEAIVYGREQDKEAIIELLLRDEGGCDGVAVIPITGMGGVGKTTLTKLLYNDIRVQGHFDLKVWVYVSDDFDVITVTKTILRSISTEMVEDGDLNLLQVKLKEKLFRKKLLLVLDDVWNENYDDWTVLCHPFEASCTGSKILVTTRNQGVSSMVGTLPTYPLKELSNNDCMCVFTQHSLGAKDFSQHQDLKDIGKQIVKRCNGLPLVAKTLGGLLRGKYDPKEWEDVLSSKIWDFPEDKSGILPALKISYHYLPPHLKRCFAYCSIFPKGYAFQEEEIILLWMAEGFLQHEINGKQMEDLGLKCFHDLQLRSFFQKSIRNTSRFEMHDIINDLAQWAAREICFRIENMPEADKQWEISKNLRHLSYIGRKYDGIRKFEALYHVKHLRTFLPLMVPYPWHCFLTPNVLFHFLPKLQCLRVLSLHGYQIFEIPNEIGDLQHLRYLDLSCTAIKTLPESIIRLHNLQTLITESCHSLKTLCVDMGNLINLRYLNISHVDLLVGMPLSIGKLSCLRRLSNFIVGKGIGSTLRELKSLTHLRETLRISRLENVIDPEDAKEADLNGKKNLNVLLLEWTLGFRARKVEIETHVLDMLKPHTNLKELNIRGYAGIKFPTWLGDSSFSNLVLLRFEDCGTCTSLPPVGQLPSLKYLVIKGMAGVRRVGPEFFGNGCSEYFPSLETLSFEDMEKWEHLTPRGPGPEAKYFSHLRELSIVKCSKLVGRLPKHLPSLESLVIESCKQFKVSISSLPTLCRLKIDGCKETVVRSTIDLSSLNSVVLSDISSPMFLEEVMPSLWQVKDLRLVGCEKLKSLWQNKMGLLQTIRSLDELVIEHCPQLLSVVAKEDEKQQHQELTSRLKYPESRESKRLVKSAQVAHTLSSLRKIRISNCQRFVSFPEDVLPSQLRIIEIDRCNALKSLPDAWMNNDNTSLESLSIKSCNSLLYITKIQLPLNLKRLEISRCNKLQALTDDEDAPIINKDNSMSGSSRNSSLLEYLYIGYCPSLVSLWPRSELPVKLQRIMVSKCPYLASLSSRGNLPKALKYLDISFSSELESISESLENNTSLESIMISSCRNLKLLPNDMHKLRHLSKISTSDCPNLVSFPEGGLLSAKLTEISIIGCEKLEALPNCLHNLTSLQHLKIRRCPAIVSFPESGFPTNLKSLEIEDLKICKTLFKWGLHRLASLRQLTIDGGCPDVVSFPQLPVSLTFLKIKNFPNLECISSINQVLTSFEALYLCGCPKLKSFPQKGLPRSLLKLCIYKCPLLERKCEKDVGRYWPLISHIPCIKINVAYFF